MINIISGVLMFEYKIDKENNQIEIYNDGTFIPINTVEGIIEILPLIICKTKIETIVEIDNFSFDLTEANIKNEKNDKNIISKIDELIHFICDKKIRKYKHNFIMIYRHCKYMK